MSESNSSRKNGGSGGESQPRAMIHKKVLDIARSRPDASLEAIAADVSGASATFVKRVLEEYGDPAAPSSRTERADGRGNTQSEADTNVVADEAQYDDAPPTEQVNGADPNHEGTSNADNTEPTSSAIDAVESPAQSSSNTDTPAKPKSIEPTESTEKTQQPEVSNSAGSTTESESQIVTDPSELSDKQRETLLSVQQEPTATQEEIANRLGVTRATISKRLNDISGFSWKTRSKFVDELFDDSNSDSSESEATESIPASRIADIESRINRIEARLETTSSSDSESPFGPELAHKVVHSCMQADYLSEEEELELLRELL